MRRGSDECGGSSGAADVLVPRNGARGTKTTTTEMTIAAFRSGYAKARALFSLLPQFYELNFVTDSGLGHIRFMDLNSAGLPIFDYTLETLTEEEAMHEAGHAYKKLLERKYPYRNFGEEYWANRGFPGTYAKAKTELANKSGSAAWIFDPNESWAEAFRIAVSLDAKPPNNEHTYDFGKGINPEGVRAFFRSLSPSASPSEVPVPPPPAPKGTPMNGCDISSYQGNVDFDLLKQEMKFVISKATEGSGYQDPTFHRNWTETDRTGMIPGAYHFARPDLGLSAQDEARWFLANLGPLDGRDLLALDYEVQWNGDVVGWCKAWLDFVKSSTGTAPFIYLNLSLVRAHDWSSVISAGYPLWLAFYDGEPDTFPQTPWPSVAMKQWTSSGSVSGIAGNVDLNTWQEEDDMFSDADRALLQRVKDLLEAREALVWAARGQRFLDVETGKAYDPNKAPADPRIKT